MADPSSRTSVPPATGPLAGKSRGRIGISSKTNVPAETKSNELSET